MSGTVIRQLPQYPKPIGAVWLNGTRLVARVKAVLREQGITLPKEQLDFIVRGSCSLKIKINAYPEKYIAVENKRKVLASGVQATLQPDFFVHLLQQHTGAPIMEPWRA